MEGDSAPAVASGTVAERSPPAATSAWGRTVVARWTVALPFAAVGAALVTLLGAIFDPEDAAPAILVMSQYVLGIGLGGLAFVAFTYVTGAGWSAAIRRVPEALAATIPLGALLTLVALAFLPWLYEWSHTEVVAEDAILQEKTWWLNTGFFLLRAVACLGIWILFARVILGVSKRQDLSREIGATVRNRVLSAAFIAVFAVTFSVATFDWLMSREPHWFSTVYAIYNFSGLFVSSLSAILLAAIVLRRLGPWKEILRAEHLHDLAKLVFGFATFWAYIWFCQYMLIWYANIPEETSYFATRESGSWHVLMLANVVVNWLIPFLVLLPKPAKRNESILIKVAILLLVGRWLDLYLMVVPAGHARGPTPTLWDLSAMVLGVSLLLLVLFRILSRERLVPRGDPMLEESLHYHS